MAAGRAIYLRSSGLPAQAISAGPAATPLGRAGSRGFRSGLQAASAAEVKADSWCPRQADAMSDLLQNGRSSRRLRTDEPPKSSYSGEGLGALDPHTAIAGLRAPRLSALRGRSLALTRFAGHFAA